ncbi:FecR family protein [Mucilaginibacter sp. 44-25]|uniref:FecR family protein n=1 Tax=Mucilaginibacter sp. 44-25 TaxID=1895794 RepID=UPI0009677A4F|nr:FecR family protein [Mucilaginibacter sp. 44-25]OJW13207.1 MAG: hypothetical protein BGO48_00110 [Mucilaginibacter sp. 44-25]HEK20652.1 FecR family protein [Bacteroidota bacterium]
MNDDNIDDLLIRYITNEATTEEMAYLQKWISAHPENEQHFAELYELWQQALNIDEEAIDTNAAYEKFHRQNLAKPGKRKSNLFYSALSCAALLLLAIGFWKLSERKLPANGDLKLVAAKGASRIFNLSDGTRVWLNGGSVLTIQKGFNSVNRTVWLSGEAFFAIGDKNSKLPFLVRTKKYAIRDIGTQFNIKAYPGDDIFEASVVQGEISVENRLSKNTSDNRIYLKAHQVLSASTDLTKYNSTGEEQPDDKFQKIRIIQMQPDQQVNFVGWKDDILAFDGNSLEEIAKTLDRRFGTGITITEDRLKKIRYSGTFKHARSATEVLDVIKENTDINYYQNGNTITIGGDGL